MLRLIVLSLAIVCSGAVSADDWGSIRGQIVVEGNIPEPELLIAKDANVKDKTICAAQDHYADDLIVDKDSKGLANVFVYLTKKPGSIHPDLLDPPMEAVSIKQVACQFTPHCVVLRTKQPLIVLNGDSIAHNTHVYPMKNQQISILIKPSSGPHEREQFEYRVPETLPVKVGCDFHPWMQGYWLIVDHPYAALTDKDGKFHIDNLPLGDHEFKIWHERAGYLDTKYKVTVAAGDPVELTVLQISIDKLQRK